MPPARPPIVFTVTPADREGTSQSSLDEDYPEEPCGTKSPTTATTANLNPLSPSYSAPAKLAPPHSVSAPGSGANSKHGSYLSLHAKEFLHDVKSTVPIAHIRRIVTEKKLGSYDRETQFFTDVTTMHGPLRVYVGNRLSTWFWGAIMICSASLLISQVVNITTLYTSKPIVSQVSFLIEDSGIQFPVVTFCNFNPIKKSWLQKINATGQFSEDLLDYLLQANVEMQALYSNANPAELAAGQKIMDAYKKNVDPRLSVDKFFFDGGFECNEIMKICSFGGRKFDCCKHAESVLTPLGRCYTLDLSRFGEPWMWKQVAAGEYNGLQVLMDSHLEEISYSGSGEEADPVFTNSFENGFRYFVHAPKTLSFVASEGISVSPDTRAYSSISSTNYVLLDTQNWGTCVTEWPEKYQTDIPYSSGNCALQCKARFYHDRCGCVPFMYNLDYKKPTCTPHEMFVCMEGTVKNNGTDFEMPDCKDCAVECESWQYNAFNSYGVGFSEGSIKWLMERNRNWTHDHIKQNFLAASIFFKDLTYTQYNQVKGISLSETLSDIGGNMGLCFGMSVITCTEISMFLAKLFWITVSKKRRSYMEEKKQKEKEKEEAVERIASEMNIERLFKAFQSQQQVSEELPDKSHTNISIDLTDEGFPPSEDNTPPGSNSERLC